MPSGRHSAKFEFFFKKKSLPSALCAVLGKVWIFFKKILCWVSWSWHSAKLEKWFSERPPIFPALPSAVTMALGNGVLCRVQHSAKCPKTAIFNFFYIPSWQINSYKHISHIYLIHHIYISFITYISHLIQINPQVHQSPQVHHKYITSPSPSEQQMKKYITWTHLGHCDCGEGPTPSFGGAWVGLFEPPSDGDCTKEKRLHVRQDYLDS